MNLWAGSTAELCRLGWDAPVRHLLTRAFAGDFSDEDWVNSLGGRHFVAVEEGEPVCHASVVPRTLVVSDRGTLRTGYVEAVGTAPERRRRGHATAVLRLAGAHVHDGYDLGALSTGTPSLYERLGWRRWRGTTWVDGPAGRERTAEEDGGILVLLTSRSAGLDLTAELTCDWRPGDVW